MEYRVVCDYHGTLGPHQNIQQDELDRDDPNYTILSYRTTVRSEAIEFARAHKVLCPTDPIDHKENHVSVHRAGKRHLGLCEFSTNPNFGLDKGKIWQKQAQAFVRENCSR